MKIIGDRRTWTDAQLRKAVEDNRSWRAVARALGLKGTSAGVIRSIKRHALRLELDAGHFTGQRRWTDGELRQAVQGSTCWSEVFVSLGISDNGSERVRIKGHAVRLDLDCSHLKTPHRLSMTGQVFDQPVRPEMLSAAAPGIAMAWFAMRGCAVALPVEPQLYDLLVTTPDGIQRVQIKSSARPDSRGRWQVGVGRRPYSLDKSAGKMPYDPDSLDLFFIVLGNGSIYLIPSSVLAGRVQIDGDSYLPYRVGDASGVVSWGALA
jgi:hypothetical protein